MLNGGEPTNSEENREMENIDKIEIKWKMNKQQKTEANRKNQDRTGGTQEILLFFYLINKVL